MKKNIYICHTLYHLLISMYKYKDGDVLVLLETIPEREEFVRRLSESKYNVEIFDEVSVVAKLGRFYSEEIVKNIEKFGEGNKVLFNDWGNIGIYFCRKKVNYILMEDGYNALASKILNKKERLRRKFKSWVYNLPRTRGYSESCEIIEVNDKSIMPKDSRFDKIVELPRKELFTKNIDIREKVLTIFNVPNFRGNSVKKKILILTQPLGVDVWYDPKINTIEKQIEYYKNIIDTYKYEYNIYLKPHPRDKVEYSIFSDVNLMEKNIPIEVYEFAGGYYFDLGITHSSTALNFLTCVDQKIILNKSNV